MKTPRNLKQAIENGYIIYNIYAKGEKRINHRKEVINQFK